MKTGIERIRERASIRKQLEKNNISMCWCSTRKIIVLYRPYQPGVESCELGYLTIDNKIVFHTK